MTQGFEHLTLHTAAERRHASPPHTIRRPRSVLLGILVLGSLGLGLGLAAFAQDQATPELEPPLGATGSITPAGEEPEKPAEAPPQPLDGQIVTQAPDTFAATDLLGQDVSSIDGQVLGTVTDILVTADNEIGGVVLDIGGFLGFGAKEVAIEYGRLIMAKDPEGRHHLVLDLTPEELEQAPEFVSLDQQREAAEAEQAQRARQEQTLQGSGAPQPNAGTIAPTQ